MQYQTRHLVANGALRHEGRDLRAGEAFEATENDAKYFVHIGLARQAEPKVQAPAPQPQPQRSPRGSTAHLQRSYPVAKPDNEGE